MDLASALRIAPGMAVAFVGAGGKSNAIRRLVAELTPQHPVLVSTTTRLGREQASIAAAHVDVSQEIVWSSLAAKLKEAGSLLVTSGLDPRGEKWTGLDREEMGWLRKVSTDSGGVLLIEADGARGRSLKAPADHEPVIPAFADLVVPVAGLDALGKPIDSEFVHRPGRVAAILGKEIHGVLAPGDLAEVLASPAGGMKGVPEAAEARVLLTRFDEATAAVGRTVAAEVLRRGSARVVVLGSPFSSSPADEVHGRVAGIVLAAGGSTRLGQPKQLVRWRGRPLVWHVAHTAQAAGLSPVIVVVGDAEAGVRDAVSDLDLTVVANDRWADGQSTSLRAGLAAVANQAEAAVFLLADMPLVPVELIRREVEVHSRSLARIVAPWAGGRWANPALFDRALFPALGALTGDRGGRALFREHPVTKIEWDDSILVDVDSPQDLRRLEAAE